MMLQLFAKIFIFILWCFAETTHAQIRVCGNKVLLDKYQENKFLEKHNNIRPNASDKKYIESRSGVFMPVVVHVVWSTEIENIPDDIIYEQIDILNRAFAGIDDDVHEVPEDFKSIIGSSSLQFCLAHETPNQQTTSGIVRSKTNQDQIGLSDNLYNTSEGGSNSWAPDRYLNIWIANTGPLIAGFGTYPNQVQEDRQGVVIHPTYFGLSNHPSFGLGKTLIHEIGHYLGLDHLWGQDIDCNTDDGVTDTPSQMKGYRNCPTHPQAGCSEKEMFMNYMDYVDDSCMYMFTKGQIERMFMTIQEYRPSLLDSDTSCKNNNQETFVKIFPNPSSGIYSIRSSRPVDEYIPITNQIGQTVNIKTTNYHSHSEFDMTLFPSGQYYIEVYNKAYRIIKL